MENKVKSRCYKWCFVPQCTNTSIATPDKVFLSVPRDENRRKLWFISAKRDIKSMPTSGLFCCQDHFELENDLENYMYYKYMNVNIRIKPGIVPHIFECQRDRKRAFRTIATSSADDFEGKVKMTGCAVLGCSNKSEKGFLMKQFPKNPVRRKEWQLNMQRPGWIPTDTSYLCEVHFEPQMWEKTRIDGTRKLKNNAVPTLFSFPKKPSKRKAPKDKTQALTTMPNCQKSENGNEIFADPLNIEDNGTLQPPVKGEEILLDTLKIEPEDNETVPLALQGEEIFADTLKIEPEDNETDLALQGEEIFADTLKIEPEDNETVLALQGEEIFADTLKIEIKTEAEDNETVQAAIHVEEILTDTLKTENDEAVQQLVVEQAENTSILLNKVKQYRRDYQKLLLKYKYSQKCLRNARLKIKKLENTLKKRR